MGDGLSYFGANLTKAVKDGEITEERVCTPYVPNASQALDDWQERIALGHRYGYSYCGCLL